MPSAHPIQHGDSWRQMFCFGHLPDELFPNDSGLRL